MRPVTTSLAVALLALAAPVHAERPLSRAERAPVCTSAKACAGILARHDANAFDYAVLADAFAKLGRKGRDGLVALAKNPETAPRAFAIAAQSETPDATRERIFALFPVPNADLHIKLGKTHASDVLRERAIASLRDHRDAAVRALETQIHPFSQDVAQAALPTLARANASAPSLAVTRLLAATPAGAPELVRALQADDPDVVVESYLALERLDADRAHADLEAAFRASPDTHVATWIRAFERIGRDSRTFDTVGFGYARMRDPDIPPMKRAVLLHSALLYPATETRRIGAENWLPELLRLPVSERLAETAPTHPVFTDAGRLRDLRTVFEARNTDAMARYAKALAASDSPEAKVILREIFEAASDYRVQVAVVDALAERRAEDISWLRDAVSRHPIHAVRQAYASAFGVQTQASNERCRLRGEPWVRTPERMPYFESGRLADGRTPGRWELVDAQPFRGGWLAAYKDGLVRYASDDTSEFVAVDGTPIAILADPLVEGEFRSDGFWVVTREVDVAWLYRFTPDRGLGARSALPPEVEVRRATETGGRDWMLAIGGGQDTLVVRANGSIVTLCSVKEPTR